MLRSPVQQRCTGMREMYEHASFQGIRTAKKAAEGIERRLCQQRIGEIVESIAGLLWLKRAFRNG